jgi:tRNA modification GTPase
VRLAGPAALPIACALTDRASFDPRHATRARVIDQASAVDDVVITWFAAPQSYTGDDVVEISGHGSPPVQRRIVELAMGAGARLAEPGEFTLRAYLNGKIDLIQAEAVADLVDAVTPLQARAAMDQLEGTLTTRIRGVDAALFDLAAKLEASLDFPDEGFHFVTRSDARADLDRVRAGLDALAADGRAGRVVREGRLIVIAGPPNAGKSSLFNALVGASRAIVTPIPGTTRDALTERVDLAGLAVTLVDTAGLRETTDPIEAEGVARTQQARAAAALTLIVVDGSEPLSAEARALLMSRSPASLVVVNKVDRPAAWGEEAVAGVPLVRVSAATSEGLDLLRARVATELTGRDDWRDPPALLNVRHIALVDEARTALTRAATAIDAGASEEVVLDEISVARTALESIGGRRTADDLLHHIFASFCVGK